MYFERIYQWGLQNNLIDKFDKFRLLILSYSKHHLLILLLLGNSIHFGDWIHNCKCRNL